MKLSAEFCNSLSENAAISYSHSLTLRPSSETVPSFYLWYHCVGHRTAISHSDTVILYNGSLAADCVHLWLEVGLRCGFIFTTHRYQRNCPG